MSLVAQITGNSPQARIVSAAPLARLSMANLAAPLTPILPASVLGSAAAGSSVQGQAALIAGGSIVVNGIAYLQDDFIVNAALLAARQVRLTHMAGNPDQIELSIFGGIEQRPNVDFLVTGQFLSWAGLGMELLLEPGTAFSVRYAPEASVEPPVPPSPPPPAPAPHQGDGVNAHPAAVTLSAARAVRFSAQGLRYASVTEPEHADAVLGITLAAAMAPDPVLIRREGEMTEPSWSWLPNEPVFLAANGFLTQAPDPQRVLVELGVALTPTRLLVRIQQAIYPPI